MLPKQAQSSSTSRERLAGFRYMEDSGGEHLKTGEYRVWELESKTFSKINTLNAVILKEPTKKVIIFFWFSFLKIYITNKGI